MEPLDGCGSTQGAVEGAQNEEQPVDQLSQIRITLMRKIRGLDPHQSEKSDEDMRSLQHLRF